MVLMPMLLLIISLGTFFSPLAGTIETTILVPKDVLSRAKAYQDGSRISYLKNTEGHVSPSRDENYANVAPNFRLKAEVQECRQTQAHDVLLDRVVQAMGKKCVTPGGWCELTDPLPINSSCCCPRIGCGYVYP